MIEKLIQYNNSDIAPSPGETWEIIAAVGHLYRQANREEDIQLIHQVEEKLRRSMDRYFQELPFAKKVELAKTYSNTWSESVEDFFNLRDEIQIVLDLVSKYCRETYSPSPLIVNWSFLVQDLDQQVILQKSKVLDLENIARNKKHQEPDIETYWWFAENASQGEPWVPILLFSCWEATVEDGNMSPENFKNFFEYAKQFPDDYDLRYLEENLETKDSNNSLANIISLFDTEQNATRQKMAASAGSSFSNSFVKKLEKIGSAKVELEKGTMHWIFMSNPPTVTICFEPNDDNTTLSSVQSKNRVWKAGSNACDIVLEDLDYMETMSFTLTTSDQKTIISFMDL